MQIIVKSVEKIKVIVKGEVWYIYKKYTVQTEIGEAGADNC